MKTIKKILLKILDRFFPRILYSIKSYSQDGEDMLLRSFYEGMKGYKGFYVDIGAHHPFRFSNTAYFYKQGWNGINIEPTPRLIKAFKRFRKRDINLNYGVSDHEETLKFYEFNEPALNGFSRNLSYSRNKANNKYKIINTMQMKVYTLETILDIYLPKNRKIDFFNIDVEGLDLNVLKSNNWDKYNPDYILVEEVNESNDIYSFLIDKNYKLIGKTKRTSLFRLNVF